MGRQSAYKISIPKPCHEDWDNMTHTEKGKFCDACQKNVIDFTRFSDQEIIRLIEKFPNGLCGRTYDTQLNRVMYEEKYHAGFSFKAQLLGSLLALATLQPVISHASKPAIEYNAKFDEKIKPAADDSSSLHDSTYTIKGKVVDINKKPMPFVLVIVSGTTNGVTTNDQGEFEIILSGNAILKVYNVGYETSIVKITDEVINKNLPIEIVISPWREFAIETLHKTGGVVAHRITQERTIITNPSENKVNFILGGNR